MSLVDRELADEILRAARRRGGSFAELFVEQREITSIRLDDGKVEELTTGRDRGSGRVVGVYADWRQRVTIASSEGRWIEEAGPRIGLVAQVVAARGDVIQTGWYGPAAMSGVEFLDRFPPRAIAEKAATRAVT